jgi:23S rRNA (adenine2503-C2)-methyltransferase
MIPSVHFMHPTFMQHILDSHDELAIWFAEHKQPAFRAEQLRQWLFEKRAEQFEEMSNLPKELRSQLAESFRIWTSTTAKHSHAADGTEKLLLQLADGGQIECVLLREEGRRSICVSSQVGCAMGCVFCASGLDGVDRNLTTGEVIEQMLRLARLLPQEERLSHIVVMGMGEPLANLDRLLPALETASSQHGLGISPRRITISTVGLPPAMRRLTDECPKYNLAVSLHAPNDKLRNELVPVNRNIGLKAIMTEADRYFEASGRRLTFEYVLLGGLNDRPEHARELASLLRGRPALLNVIPYNPVAGLPYETPNHAAQKAFREILQDRGINVQFRQRKGDEINAACGQLRRSTPQIVPLNSPETAT